MQTGYSLLLRQFISAIDVDYGDCAEFQITCPACSEAVFKAGAIGGERQYLAHYASTMSNVSDCELRVRALSHEQTDRANKLGQDQTLEQFFTRFQEPVLDWVFGGFDDYDRASTRLEFNRAMFRPSFLNFANHMRMSEIPAHIREDVHRTMWDGIIGSNFEARSKFWIKRQRGFAADFLRHLEARNSLAAWSFLVAIVFALRTRGHAREMLLTAKEPAFKRWLRKLDPDLHSELVGLAIINVRKLLILIPYTDILGYTSRNTKKHRDILLRMCEKQGFWEEEVITDEERKAREERAKAWRGSESVEAWLASFPAMDVRSPSSSESHQ